jgi:hypothetical protein
MFALAATSSGCGALEVAAPSARCAIFFFRTSFLSSLLHVGAGDQPIPRMPKVSREVYILEAQISLRIGQLVLFLPTTRLSYWHNMSQDAKQKPRPYLLLGAHIASMLLEEMLPEAAPLDGGWPYQREVLPHAARPGAYVSLSTGFLRCVAH